MRRDRIQGFRLLCLLAACHGLGASPVRAQGVAYVKEHYTKYEYRIRMRDGDRLFTAVYVPKDTTVRYPLLLQRTPYSVGPYGADQYKAGLGPSPQLARSGYIFAYQDVRGCYLSEGQFVDIRPEGASRSNSHETDESTDTFDTIEWLVNHVPGNNGKVGLWGISYPGFYAAAGLIGAHSALKAVSPQAPLVDCFLGDDTHHNGAFFLHQEFNFDAAFGLPRPEPSKKSRPRFDHESTDAYDFFLRMGPLSEANTLHFKKKRAFWNEIMAHGTYDDFWKSRALLRHLKDIKPAVMTVGGWYDAEDLYGPLHTYQTIEATSPQASNTLVMGPWSHGGWARGDGIVLGPVSFASKTAEFYRESIELPFFEHHLKQQGKWDPPEAWVFETGVNLWRRHDRWPPREARARALYLEAGGRLSFEAPSKRAGAEFDEFISDPDRPVPYTATISINCPSTYVVEDQRFAARRPDVLVYETGPLSEDVTVVGPVGVQLYVATTGTDADWVVKLIDVYPDDYPDPEPNPAGLRMGGYQQLVRGDVMRGKFRRSFENPEPFAPGVPTEVGFSMQDVDHTFRTGHRIMVQVQSSWFPLVDRNPQKFVDIYSARSADFHTETHRVYRSADRSSRLRLLIMP